MSEILLNYGYDLENDQPNNLVVQVNESDDHFEDDDKQRLMSSSMMSKVSKITIDLTGVRTLDHDVLEVFKDFKKSMSGLDTSVQFMIKQFASDTD